MSIPRLSPRRPRKRPIRRLTAPSPNLCLSAASVGPHSALAMLGPVRKTGRPETKMQKVRALNGSFAYAVAHDMPREINLWSFFVEGMTHMKRQTLMITFHAALMVAAASFLSSCNGGSGTPPPVPQIQNIDSSTTPTSPVGLPIEINGSGFQSAPGKVVFTPQGGTPVDAPTPSSSAWSDTGIVATVPASLTASGTVSVTVVTSGGTSNAVTLNLVATITFNPSNMSWTTTMPLPSPQGLLTGLRAVAVPGTS